jgi:predicted nucleic acid-binding protein
VKLFVDANTLISGLLYRGNERILLDLGRYGACDLVTIEYVRGEVEDYLSRPKVRLSDDEQRRLMTILDRSVVVLHDPPPEKVREVRGRIRDEEDLPVLAGFEVSGADYLVTGDRELRRGTRRGITTRRSLELLLDQFE